MSTTTSTLQTTYSRHQHNQRTEQNDLTLPTDRNWPITTDQRYLSLTANNITAKLTNQFSPITTDQRYLSLTANTEHHDKTDQSVFTSQTYITFDWQTTLSLDSDDDFRSGCRNVSHCHRQWLRTTLTRTITLHDRLNLKYDAFIQTMYMRFPASFHVALVIFLAHIQLSASPLWRRTRRSEQWP